MKSWPRRNRSRWRPAGPWRCGPQYGWHGLPHPRDTEKHARRMWCCGRGEVRRVLHGGQSRARPAMCRFGRHRIPANQPGWLWGHGVPGAPRGVARARFGSVGLSPPAGAAAWPGLVGPGNRRSAQILPRSTSRGVASPSPRVAAAPWVRPRA
jgi:hypothetical protein